MAFRNSLTGDLTFDSVTALIGYYDQIMLNGVSLAVTLGDMTTQMGSLQSSIDSINTSISGPLGINPRLTANTNRLNDMDILLASIQSDNLVARAAYMRTAAQAIAASTEVLLATETNVIPIYNISWNYPTRQYTITNAGTYLVIGHLMWAADVGGQRQIRIIKNGALFDLTLMLGPQSTGANEYQMIVRTLQLAVGDTISIAAYSTSTTSLVTDATRMYSGHEIYRIGT